MRLYDAIYNEQVYEGSIIHFNCDRPELLYKITGVTYDDEDSRRIDEVFASYTEDSGGTWSDPTSLDIDFVLNLECELAGYNSFLRGKKGKKTSKTEIRFALQGGIEDSVVIERYLPEETKPNQPSREVLIKNSRLIDYHSAEAESLIERCLEQNKELCRGALKVIRDTMDKYPDLDSFFEKGFTRLVKETENLESISENQELKLISVGEEELFNKSDIIEQLRELNAERGNSKIVLAITKINT